MFTRSTTRTVTAFVAGLAVTAATAVTFQAMSVNAIDADETTFVPINPCRLFDTRPAPDNIGSRNAPLGAAETHTQQVTGSNGNCSLPTDATAIAMNVTALDATAPSFLQLWPADQPQPDEGSSLNYLPGQVPTPNKVDVQLSASGAVAIFNAFGNVNIIGDVVGYYTNSGLQELQAEVDALRAAQSFTLVSPQSDSVNLPSGTVPVPIPVAIASGAVAPGDGVVVLEGTVGMSAPLDATTVSCLIGTGGTAGAPVTWRPSESSDTATLVVRRAVEVEAGDSLGGAMICNAVTPVPSVMVILQPMLTATFTGQPPTD